MKRRLELNGMRVPDAVAQLHAGNIKALGDALAYLEEIDIAPAEVIRQSAARLGEPSRKHLGAWDLAEAIDKANGNKSARSIYRRLYVPLCNFTVHASGGTLLRHIGCNGKPTRRPSRS